MTRSRAVALSSIALAIRLTPPLLAAITVVSACNAPADDVSESYTVVFPSSAAAIVTDTVQIDVYAVRKADDCQPIFERRRTGQDLPKPLASTGEVRTCDVLAGKVGQLDVGFGTRAFLAVGKNGGDEILIGCEVRVVDDRSPAPSVRLSLFDPDKGIPSTDCKSLGDKCGGRCP